MNKTQYRAFAAACTLLLLIPMRADPAGGVIPSYATSTNINLAKSLTASATASGVAGASRLNPLDYYVSGDDATYGRVTIAPTAGYEYKVDLGSPCAIGPVSFSGYLSGAYAATSYSIAHSLDDSVWTTNVYVPSGGGSPYAGNLAGARARYLRLVGHAFNHASLWIITDANIYGSRDPAPVRDHLNIGGARANAAPVAQLDGVNKTNMNDEAATYALVGNAASLPKVILLRLDKAYYVKGVRWHVYAPAAHSRPTAYTVEASHGGAAWTTVFSYSGVAIDFSKYNGFDGVYGVDGILADRVRVTVTGIDGAGSGSLYINQMEVFGTALPLGRRPEAEYVYAHTESVNLAKNLNTTGAGGSHPLNPLNYHFSTTGGYRNDISPTPGNAYTVDLGAVYPVGAVEFKGYTASYQATSYSIAHSLNGAAWTTNQYVASGGTAPYRADLGAAQARYVQIKGYAFDNTIWIISDCNIYAAGGPLPVQDHISIGGMASGDAFAGRIANAVTPKVNDEQSGFLSVGNAAAMPKTISIQLDKSYMLKSTRMHFYVAGTWSTPTAYTIEVSDGVAAWTQVYSYSGSAVPFDRRDIFTGAYGTDGILADRVRITFTAIGGASDGLYLEEIQVFGSTPPRVATTVTIR